MSREKAERIKQLSLEAHNADDTLEAAIRREEELSDWLQRMLQVTSDHAANTASFAQETNEQAIEKVLLAQQEELIAEKITASRVSRAILASSDGEDELLKHAILETNREQEKSIELQKQLDDTIAKLDVHVEKCHELQSTVQREWQEIRDTHASRAAQQQQITQEDEVVLLKGLLRDMIIGCHLDWYNDDRLRRIMLDEET